MDMTSQSILYQMEIQKHQSQWQSVPSQEADCFNQLDDTIFDILSQSAKYYTQASPNLVWSNNQNFSLIFD